MWDRFDICEAYACLAHDWGLYDVQARLNRMGFKARLSLTTDTLEDNAAAIYEHHDYLLRNGGCAIRTQYS